jgi:ParB family chromosome partitioning protein
MPETAPATPLPAPGGIAFPASFDPAHPIAALRPATYNPRRITEDSLAELRASVRALGVVKPVIVTDGGTLVAGHQRTRAMLAEGLTHCPAFVLAGVNATDEVRFNQLHNATDIDWGDEEVWAPPCAVPGFRMVAPGDLRPASLRCRNAPKKTEILRLLSRYGDWGGCVAGPDGRVLVSGLYALCCHVLRRPCLTYYLPAGREDEVRRFFGRPYGAFSYDHLPRTTWAQSLAQMMRLRERKSGSLAKDGTAKGKSRTYENLVLPRLDPAHPDHRRGLRLLDFGAGQMDYVRRLQDRAHRLGVEALGLEFYRRRGRRLDVPQVHRDITAVCRALAERGRFDLLVCDSVLNSVDSARAEADVLTCLAALCRPGGTVVFSGRSRDSILAKEERQTTNTDPDTRYVHFLDAHGFSAMYANGVWRYQLFHDLAGVRRLAEEHFGGDYAVFTDEGRPAEGPLRGSGWGVVAVNGRPRPAEHYLPSLEREFDLPLPGGGSYGRGADIAAAFRAALAREAE